MNIESEDTREEDKQDAVEYLLRKGSFGRRKASDFASYDRPNFVLRHETQQYTVVRVYINSFDSSQIKLYYSKFTPKQKAGTICIIHGYGESSDDYLETASYFAKQGFVVNLIDLRGFGYSGGCRVNCDVRGVLSDIQNLLRYCCEIGLPTYILSHGFGSLLVLALLQENPGLPLAGVITMSPLFSFPYQHSNSWTIKLLLSLSPSMFDQIQINNMINPTALTNNPDKLRKSFEGVFNYQYITIKMAAQYAQIGQKVCKDAVKFVYPLLVCCGGQNMVQPLGPVKTFYKGVSSREKSSFVYGRGYHQLYNDVNAEQEVFTKIIQWIWEDSSVKNNVKWAKTASFNLKIIKQPIKKRVIGTLLLAIVGLLVFILRRIRSNAKLL